MAELIHIQNTKLHTYENDIRALVNAFYPGAVLDESGNTAGAVPGELILDIDALEERVRSGSGGGRFEEKSALKRALYMQLAEQTGRTLPWGTLTGIRPVRIVEMLEAEGLSGSGVRSALRERFFISEEKIGLLTDIAEREKRLLEKIDYRNGCSVYIGIPFCPTRCLYCSFASNPAGKDSTVTDRYLDSLIREMEMLAEGRKDTAGAAFRREDVRTVYVGGGTPTALSAVQLDRLLDAVRRYFLTADRGLQQGQSSHLPCCTEFTVEAGRPDSITPEKLEVLKNHGVTRISINPQTFHQKTLDLIGRRHTPEDVYRAYALARSAGFDNINMDLIMGLPGEDLEDVRYTLDCVRELGPESLTVHTLAVKRASRLSTEGKAWGGLERKGGSQDAEEAAEVAAMTALGAACAAELGMKPYYIYRQKSMAGNQENTGYALPGRECLYNILMMEEKHTVLGLGAGSSTKTVTRENAGGRFTAHVTRTANVKDLAEYMRRF